MTTIPKPTPCDRCGEADAEWPAGELSYCQDCWEYYTGTAFWEALAEAEAPAEAMTPAQQMQRVVDLHHYQRNANAEHSSVRPTVIAPDCRPGDLPQDFPGN